jgi:hypothetical protein
LLEHDLFGKPVPAFQDHAEGPRFAVPDLGETVFVALIAASRGGRQWFGTIFG